MEELMKIGGLAKKTGSTIDTIRFYEDKGLITPAKRSEKGYRLYSSKTLATLDFINTAKKLGFTLSEIKEFLNIQIKKDGRCSTSQSLIKAKQAEIEEKLKELEKIKNALAYLERQCAKNSKSQCHFLEVLK